MTAEQFADAIGSLTGEWEVDPTRGSSGGPPPNAPKPTGSVPSQPTAAGIYARDWHVASNDLTRALGRPIRDQVISTRASQSTTPQALELVNGETLDSMAVEGCAPDARRAAARARESVQPGRRGPLGDFERVRHRRVEGQPAVAHRAGERIQ